MGTKNNEILVFLKIRTEIQGYKRKNKDGKNVLLQLKIYLGAKLIIVRIKIEL